jgi:UDP-glucose 4-epimerase
MMLCVVTGGAGFIGSHLVDALVARGDDVVVIDSLLHGDRQNIAEHLGSGKVQLVQEDLLSNGWQKSVQGADRVYHLAADPDVRQGSLTPDSQIENNILVTYRVLEAMRNYQVPRIVFTSTSTVYGDASVIPTPEDYTPLEPVSVYGASKLASEALISSYCHGFGMQGWIYRFANIIGERSGHGVITDFIKKLEENPHELEILGDGRQIKSYLDVKACVDGMLYVVDHSDGAVNTYNIGSEDWIDVTRIANIVVRGMGLTGVRYRYSGGERGWVGDVPKMQLSVEKIKRLGWKPGINSEKSVESAVQAILGSFH